MSNKAILRVFENRAVFENTTTGNCILVTLGDISSRTRELQVCEKSQLPDLGVAHQVLQFEVLYGLYDLLSGPYVALVVDSEEYVYLNSISFRKAKKILVVPLFRSGWFLSEIKQQDEDRYLQLLHLAFSEHSLFFSLSNDVTLTQQALSQLSPRQLSEPIWTRADHRFFWNRDVVIDLIACEADEWITPFMSAYIEFEPGLEIPDTKFSLLFISRRSRYRQGCRFTKRGLDEVGNAANFVETEQVLIFPNGTITAHVQVRGSIPLKWSSPAMMKYAPPVYIDDDRSASEDVAVKHFQDLTERYSDERGNASIICINLVDNKKEQGRLGSSFADVMKVVQTKIKHPLYYVWFDFHHECKQKGKWNNLSKLVTQVEEKFKSQRFFCRSQSGSIVSLQIGVVRTNCMDNLDRTNVVQSMLARRSLVLQLGREDVILQHPTALYTPWKDFEKVYKNIWVNNANAISMGYAGTGALKVDFTKTGKRTIKGIINDGVNSCMRYYINNFTDGHKQDAIDLLLGLYRPDVRSPSPFQQKQDQESLADNLIKSFVLLMIIFSGLLVAIPLAEQWLPLYRLYQWMFLPSRVVTPGADDFHGDYLNSSLVLSFLITSAILSRVLYEVMLKGSSIGERIVVHPCLVPERIHTLAEGKAKR